MSGYELQYDAGLWYPLPDSGDARAFAEGLAAALEAERPDITPSELDDLRAVAETAVATRPPDASESFLFLPADVGALGIVHLVIVVPAPGEVYSADDLLAASDDALLSPVRTDLELAGLGSGSRILAVTPGGGELPTARIEYLFAEGPAVLMASALARSMRDAGIMTVALDEMLGGFRWMSE